jgi:hypothetical protein
VKKPLAVIVAVVKGDAAQSVYYCGAFVVFGGVGMGGTPRVRELSLDWGGDR